MSRSSNGGYDWKPIHATGTWHNSRTSWPTETGAGRLTNAAGPETAATSSALSGSTAPALTSTRPNPSGPPWKPAAPPCGAKGPGPHPVRKPTRHGGTATIVVSRKRSPADTRSFDVRWNRTAPAGSSSPCAAARSTDGSKPTSHSSPTSRNSPKPQDPAKPPTGTEDRTGRARRSVSRKPDRPATGSWKK